MYFRHIKGQKSKIGNLKKAQQEDKAKTAQVLEEAQKRETNSNDDASALKVRESNSAYLNVRKLIVSTLYLLLIEPVRKNPGSTFKGSKLYT